MPDDQNPPDAVGPTTEQFAQAADVVMNEIDAPYEVDENSGKMKVNVGSLTHTMQSKVKKHYAQCGVLSSMMKNGMGKSSLGWHICKKIARNKFSFGQNFFFDGTLDDIKHQTDELKTGNVLFMDELVRYWYNRSAMSKKSIDLNKWMAADQRKTGVILWGAIPDFWMLDPYLRNGRVDVYVECIARGWGVVFKSQNFVHTDPWHEDAFLRIAKTRSKRRGKSTLDGDIELLQKHPCYSGLVFWNRMPTDVEKEYKRVLKEKLKVADDEIKEDSLEKFKKQFATEHELEKLRAWEAVIGLSHMLDLRNIPLGRQLREAGIDRAEFLKYKKILEKSDDASRKLLVEEDVNKMFGSDRLTRKPSTMKQAVIVPESPVPAGEFVSTAPVAQTNQETVMSKPKLSFADRFPNLSNKRKFEEEELEAYEKEKNGGKSEEDAGGNGDDDNAGDDDAVQ